MGTNEKQIQDLLDLKKISNEKEMAWVKQCISVIGIILGLIISLKPSGKETLTTIDSHLFIIAISSSGLCVLSGLVYLYSEPDTYHLLANKHFNKLKMTPNASRQDVLTIVAPRKIFTLARWLFFVLLFLSVISLVAYSISKEVF